MSAPFRAPAASADVHLLAEMAADIGAGHDLDDLLGRFLTPLVTLAGAQAGAVRVFCDELQRLRLVSQVGLSAEAAALEAVVDRHCGVCGVAADEHRPVWTTAGSGCRLQGEGGPVLTGSTCGQVMAVPLTHRGRMLGIYTLFFEMPSPVEPRVQSLLAAVGDLLGLALDNARLERESLRARLLAERQRLAAEVHDSVAQTLTFVKMRLPLLAQSIEAAQPAQALRYLEDVRGAVGQAHTSLREILTHHRAPTDPRGLWHALSQVARDFPRHSGVELAYANRAADLELSAEQEAQAYHVVREALANIAQHARARRAWLTVDDGSGEHVEIRIEDDGEGAPQHAAAGPGAHHGLAIMDERARRLGGRLEIGPRPGGGTIVRLSFPRRGASPEAQVR